MSKTIEVVDTERLTVLNAHDLVAWKAICPGPRRFISEAREDCCVL